MDRLKKAISEAVIGEASKSNVLAKAKEIDNLLKGKDLDDPEVAAEVLAVLADVEDELEMVGERRQVREAVVTIGTDATLDTIMLSAAEEGDLKYEYTVKGKTEAELSMIRKVFDKAVRELE